ncbi:MAG: RbsD/FucU domain-containing protein [Thermomicrobiales bacterium]
MLHPELSRVLPARRACLDYLLIEVIRSSGTGGTRAHRFASNDDKSTVLDVLAAIEAEWSIDRIVITEEMTLVSPQRVAELESLLPGVRFETVSHIELKRLGRSAKATIRTRLVPYANCINVSG